jgi:hypothetical protein
MLRNIVNQAVSILVPSIEAGTTLFSSRHRIATFLGAVVVGFRVVWQAVVEEALAAECRSNHGEEQEAGDELELEAHGCLLSPRMIVEVWNR